MSKITLATITNAFADAKLLQHKYLEQHGWKYTCDTPGCYWLWERQLKDGRVLLCSESEAMTVTENL